MASRGLCDEDVVISGIGCRFPGANSIEQLSDKLFQGENLVTPDEKSDIPGYYENLAQVSGKIQDFRKFDMTFFGISNAMVQTMDPMTRLILEMSFEALVDAGLNPSDLKGSNAEVYSGTTISDHDLDFIRFCKRGFRILSRSRCMNSNRISYWLDLRGNSVATEANWANGIVNLQLAWDAISNGRCDTAIVSTASVHCHPAITIQMNDLGVLSRDGATRSFDDAGDGHARSDAVVVLVLQRASIAKRCYASISHIISKCYGDYDDVVSKPCQEHWEELLNEFYGSSNIDKNDVCYIEGHGSAIKEEDAAEINAIANVFCKNREKPLYIGSVKSNLGHTESSSALVGLVKAIISLENIKVPQNLHFNSPNQSCSALLNGNLKVVDKNTVIPEDGLVGINAHGFGGVYAHVVLRPNPRPKTLKYDGIPRLVLLADRTNELIPQKLEKIESMEFDAEHISLLHDLHSKQMDKYFGLGYTILPKPDGQPVHEHKENDEVKRPVWFIFSGMGSQWPGMGNRLMDLPIFRKSIERSHRVLETKNLNLIDIITSERETFDNILHSFIGIAAIQIALVDVLKALDVTPDGMIGHSVGELGCAYADGCLTAEQMILCAYSRGKASIEAELIKGFMAAIGKSYMEMKDILPEDVEVACHNSSDSCTISGPAESVQKYVEQLKSEGVFARTVNVSNIAYHSRYIRPAAPKLLQYLKDVIPEPLVRSSRWISTSIAEDDWNSDLAKYCSAEYHTNNLLSSVLFEEGSKHVPENAVCIEIAPHGLLQAILKRSYGNNCVHIPLTRRSTDDALIFLSQAIGRMYMAGIKPQISYLYPKIEYPVSRGTQSLHQFVHWLHEHDITYHATKVEKRVVYSLKHQLLKFKLTASDYQVAGINHYPISIILHLIWEIFASLQKKKIEDCPVSFRKVRIEKVLPIRPSEKDDVTIVIQPGTGNFEVATDSVITQGFIYSLEKSLDVPPESRIGSSGDRLIASDIYSDLAQRGCLIGGQLNVLLAAEVNEEGWAGEIQLSADWVQIIESLIQLQYLQKGEHCPSAVFPLSVMSLSIDPLSHAKYKSSLSGSEVMTAHLSKKQSTLRCGGIELRDLQLRELPSAKSTLKFGSVDYFAFDNPSMKDSWRFVDLCFDILTDNVWKKEGNITVLEILNGLQLPPVGPYLLRTFPQFKINVEMLRCTDKNRTRDCEVDLIVCDESSLKVATEMIQPRGFVLVRRIPRANDKIAEDVFPVARYSNEESLELLLMKKGSTEPKDVEFILLGDNDAVLSSKLKNLDASKRAVYLVGSQLPKNGFHHYKERIQAESPALLRWIFILDENARKFDALSPFYRRQIKKGLVTNIYHKGTWKHLHNKTFVIDNFDITNLASNSRDGDFVASYVGLELSDNLLPQQVEFSGRLTVEEKKIMGITLPTKSDSVAADPLMSWSLPPSWTLEDGATVPLSYALAYYCLIVIGKLSRHDTILITDGWSWNGQAAISVALPLCKRVIATVSNKEEIRLLRKRFPLIRPEDVLIHADKNYDVLVGLITQGKFVQVIYNSLEGDLFMSCIKCMTARNRFFQLGRKDMRKDVDMGTHVFLNSGAFYSVSPFTIQSLQPETKRKLRDLVTSGVQNGVVQPLPRIVLSIPELKDMHSSEKILAETKKVVLAVEKKRDGIQIDGEGCLILGDESDSWVDIAEWLVRRGACNIIAIQSAPVKTQQAVRRVKLLETQELVRRLDGTKQMLDVVGQVKQLQYLSNIFILSMTAKNRRLIIALDRMTRDNGVHFVVISKEEDSLSELCKERYLAGFPSTNFVWEAGKEELSRNLDLVGKLCGQDGVIHVSKENDKVWKAASNIDSMLSNMLPSSMEELQALGLTLTDSLRLTELPTSGPRISEAKEVSPLIVIPGLHGDPVASLYALSKQMMYPLICVQVPRVELSLYRQATMIVQELVTLKKRKVSHFNIVGVQCGACLAIEVTRQLEQRGSKVSLVLIDGPVESLKQALSNMAAMHSQLWKLAGSLLMDVTSEIENDPAVSEEPWQERVENLVSASLLPWDSKEAMKDAFSFIYLNLRALLEYDLADVKLEGPVTVINSQENIETTTAIQLSNIYLVRNIAVGSRKVLDSKELVQILHGSAISQAMSPKTLHYCLWKDLEDFFLQEETASA